MATPELEQKKRELLDEIERFKHEREQFEKEQAAFFNEHENQRRQMDNVKVSVRKAKAQRAKIIISYVFVIIFLVPISVEFLSAVLAPSTDYDKNSLLQSREEELKGLEQQIIDRIGINTQDVETTILSDENASELNSYIKSLERRTIEEEQKKEFHGIDYYQHMDIMELQNYYLSDTGNDTVFPGAIIRGDSLFKGNAYALVVAERTPLYLTSNQQNSKPVMVSDVSYRTVNEALQQFQNETGNGPAKEWTYTLNAARSTHELQVKLGVSAANVGIGVGADLQSEKSTIAVVYTQTYYTVSVEPLGAATDYFNTGTDLAILGDYEPAYVSSVNYGRMIVVLVTSDMEMSELSAELSAKIKGVSIEAGIANIAKTEDMTYQIYQYGGETGNMDIVTQPGERQIGLLEKIDIFFYGTEEDEDSIVSEINQYIAADSELKNPVPISYQLKYLSDNAVVPQVYIANEYRTLERYTGGEE